MLKKVLRAIPFEIWESYMFVPSQKLYSRSGGGGVSGAIFSLLKIEILP